MLTIRNFTKRYGDRTILNIDKLTLLKGVHWFKGKNGSGKTTLFKSLSGIIPCEGEVLLNERINLTGNPVLYRSMVNYCEAEPMYPGFLTPIELVRFIGNSKKATTIQQKELLDLFGITDFQTKSLTTCSSGMVKKLSLSLAFLGHPKVIILDEPLITLDDNSRTILIDLIKRYVEELGVVCLISSHQEIDHNSLPIASAFVVQDGKVNLI